MSIWIDCRNRLFSGTAIHELGESLTGISKYMKNFFIFTALIVVCSLSVLGQDCSILKNGTYRVEYDSSFSNYPKSLYRIVNNNCYVTENNNQEKYHIVKLNKCAFRLTSDKILDTSKLTQLEKLLTKREPFFDIYKVDGNTYYFVYRVDLHVQSYSGRFLKVKD